MDTTGSNLPALFRPIVVPRPSLTGDRCAEPVLGLLGDAAGPSWTPRKPTRAAPTPKGACTSAGHQSTPLPGGAGVLAVQATPTKAHAEPWMQEFGPDVPSRAVAAFLQALISHADR